jgi:hypothetical protein
MANKWLAHVKKTMKSHKGLKFGQVLKLAKKTYKKHGGGDEMAGGAEDVEGAAETGESKTAAPVTAGRRRTRRGRKSRRGGSPY